MMFQINFFQKLTFRVQMTFILAGSQLPLQYFMHTQQGKRNTAALCGIKAVPRGYHTYYIENRIKVINADSVLRAPWVCSCL